MNYSILDAIGNTPLVEIKTLNPNPNVKILVKLEYTNPGGSIKDRAARFMIEAGEKSGELTPAKTVIEATSGNTGIGLALVCAVKGYRLLLAMSDAASIERRKILKARGAEILLTPGHLGTDGAIEEVYRLVRENPETYFMADQYNNPANWKAHYHGTAPEIWQQSGRHLTMLVATMGTSGTLMGMARRLKEYNPEIQIVGVEPFLGHKIQGLKNMKEAYCPEIFEKKRLDKKVNIDDAVYYYRTDNENSYNHNISEKNLLSYFKSTRRLIDFFEQNDKKHQYLRATEIGIVNAYRWAANAQVAFEKVDQALDYKPKSCLIRLIIKLIKKGVPVKRVNLIYLAYRKLYTLLISAPSAAS